MENKTPEDLARELDYMERVKKANERMDVVCAELELKLAADPELIYSPKSIGVKSSIVWVDQKKYEPANEKIQEGSQGAFPKEEKSRGDARGKVK